MKHREPILALVAALALLSFFPAIGSAQFANPYQPIIFSIPTPQPPPPNVLSVEVFIDAQTPGAPEQFLVLANGGDAGIDLCGLVYVFAPDGQMAACCGCPVKKGGSVTLSVNSDLLDNPAPGINPQSGLIVVVSSASCSPQAAPDLRAGMRTFHMIRSNTSSVTQPGCGPTQLPSFANNTLATQCAVYKNKFGLGGPGSCTCGPAQ